MSKKDKKKNSIQVDSVKELEIIQPEVAKEVKVPVKNEIDKQIDSLENQVDFDKDAIEKQIEQVAQDDQPHFTSKAAQRMHIKNVKETVKQEAIIEKQKIDAERARLKAIILEIEAEIEKAKLRQTQTLEDAKFEEAKIVEEAIKQKQLEAIEMRKRQELLKQRQKDITLIQQSHHKKQILIREEIAAKRAEADQKLRLGRLQIREELAAKRREAKIKNDEQRQLAIELAQTLKEERAKAHQAKMKERAKFKQEISQMKLELFAEKKRQQQELEAKRAAARLQRLKEIESVKNEALMLKQSKVKIKDDMRISKIKADIKISEQQAKLKADISEHVLDADKVKQQNKFRIANLQESNAEEIRNIELENEGIGIVAAPARALTQEQIKQRDQEAVKVFQQDYVTLVSEFKNFDKIGEKELARVKKPISEKKLNRYKEHPYYGPMVHQYIQLQEDGNFADLYTMLIAAHVVSEDDLVEELVLKKTETLQKAILQGVPIKVGPYYVMPIKKSGISSFYISHHLKDGEVIFDNHKLFSDATLHALEEIIAYKLDFGTSIKIVEGLAIANEHEQLTVAVYPNIIK